MTANNGIEGLVIETHNWGKTVAFWRGLGFELEFETDHHSGRLRHPAGGPWLFIAERPPGHALEVVPTLRVEDAAGFAAPTGGAVRRPFVREHWGQLQLLPADPDGRAISIEAPLPDSSAAP